MVTVPSAFLGNPLPLTESAEPAAPVFGLNETVVALDAADALRAATMPVDPTRTVKSTTKPATADRM